MQDTVKITPYDTMERTFEHEQQQLKNNLLMMASLVENNLKRALRGLLERDDSFLEVVLAEEKQVDLLEKQVNEQVVLYISKNAPVATDLRMMLASVKICADLERCGDQACKVARRAKELNKEPLLKELIDIPRMADMSMKMLADVMDAFVHRRPEIVDDIIARDKAVNEINKQLYRELTSFMVEDPRTITRALNLMAVSRHWERVADHAKNISRQVFFLYEGKDITHPDAKL